MVPSSWSSSGFQIRPSYGRLVARGSKLAAPWTERPGATFPRWIDESTNLREVAPGLYVGDQESPLFTSRWGLAVDLCGASRTQPGGRRRYGRAELVVSRFEDGTPVPEGLLDQVAGKVRRTVRGDMPVLIHCAAGESRSVSVAYALLRVGWGLSHTEALRRVSTPNSIPCGWPVPRTFASAKAWAESKLVRPAGRWPLAAGR